MGSRVRASVLAVACVFALGLSATAAKAGLLDGLGSVLDQILDGGTDIDPDLGDELADLLCDPSSDLAEAIENGALSALPADVIPALTCNLGLLDYKFQTTFKRSNGTEVVRTHNALVQIPRLMNVDDDIAPDLIGTIGLTGAGRFSLTVNRMLGENSTLPTKVEAIISAPSGVDIGRDTIAFGYDTTTFRAPRTFSSGISLLSLIGPGGPGIKFVTTTAGAGQSLALVGELYDKGPGGERRIPLKARVGFTPVPANVTATVDLGAPTTATVTTSQRTKVDVLGHLVNKTADGTTTEKRIDAVIDALPSTVTVSYLTEGEYQRTITYDTGQTIDRIDVTYTEKTGTTLDQKAVVTVEDLPKGLIVHQTGEVDADLTTIQGPIGAVYGSFANGEPQPAPAEPGVEVRSQGDYRSIGFRARGIEALDAHGAVPYTIDATLERQPFGVLIEDLDEVRTIDAQVNSLPHKLHLELDPDAGHVVFDGFGEGIEEITLDATDDDPFFADATQVTGAIRGLPAFLDVNFAQDKETGVTFSANEGPREIEVLASDGSTLTLPPGEAGAVYRDTAAQYAVFARVFGLKLVAVDPDPLHAVIETNRGGDFSVDARLEKVDPRFNLLTDVKTIEGTLTGLPPRVELTYEDLGPDRRRIVVDGSGASLGGIDATYTDLDPRREEIETKAIVDITGLPDTVTIEQTGPKAATLTATQPVARVEGALANGEPIPLGLDGPGLRMSSIGEPDDLDRFSSVAFRIDGLAAASVSGDLPYVVDATIAPTPFEAVIEEPEKDRTVTAVLDGLPHHFRVVVDPEEDDLPQHEKFNRPVVDFNGFGEGIGSIEITGTDERGVAEPAQEDGFGNFIRRIEAKVTELPPDVEVDYVLVNDDVSAFDLGTTQPVGMVDAFISGGSSLPVGRTREDLLDDVGDPLNSVPADQAELINHPTASGLVYNDTGPIFAFGRLRGLEAVSVTTDPLHAEMVAAADQRVDILVHDDRFPPAKDPYVVVIDGVVNELPSRLSFDLVPDTTGDGTKVDYEASSRIDQIRIEAYDILEVQDVSDVISADRVNALVRLDNVPRSVEVAIGGPACEAAETYEANGCGNVVDVDVSDGDDPEIGRIEAQLVEDEEDNPDDDGFESVPFNGAMYHALGDERYVAYAELTDFRNLDVSTAPTLTNLDFDVSDGVPFNYELRLPDSDRPQVIEGRVASPSNTSLELRPRDDVTLVNYNADREIDEVTVNMGERLDPDEVRNKIELALTNIPTVIEACIGLPSACALIDLDQDGQRDFRTSGDSEGADPEAVGAFLQTNAPDVDVPPSDPRNDPRLGAHLVFCKPTLFGCATVIDATVRLSQFAIEGLAKARGYFYADTFGTLLSGDVTIVKQEDDPDEPAFYASLGDGIRLSQRKIDFLDDGPLATGEVLCLGEFTVSIPLAGDLAETILCTD